ncbi:DUF2344 domain-containing protein [bacterium]|nr:DUF2344 domain-containing protein [bacterium]
MQSNIETFRYRMTYRISGRLRFLSHKELMRMMMRACRRARLPLAYSQGFHPHALLSFGPPRPVGMAGDAEQLDVRLRAAMPAADVRDALACQLPGEARVAAVEQIPLNAPAITACARSAWYECTWPCGAGGPEAAIARLLASDAVWHDRRTSGAVQRKDLRPGILGIAWGPPSLRLHLSLDADRYVRPTEVLAELTGLPDDALRRITVTRTGMAAAPPPAASTTAHHGTRDHHRCAGNAGTPHCHPGG